MGGTRWTKCRRKAHGLALNLLKLLLVPVEGTLASTRATRAQNSPLDPNPCGDAGNKFLVIPYHPDTSEQR